MVVGAALMVQEGVEVVQVMVTRPDAPAPPYVPPCELGPPPAPALPTTTVIVCPVVNCPALYIFDSAWLWENIEALTNQNSQKEYYVTDLIKMAFDQKKEVSAVSVSKVIEGLQPNTQAELAQLEKICAIL